MWKEIVDAKGPTQDFRLSAHVLYYRYAFNANA